MCDSQRVSAWELLEGHKNPAPLSWAWFRAVRLERKPLTYQNAHKLLRYHTHSQIRAASHYLDPPPLPPEDLEPDKKESEPGKADTPMSIDSPGRVGGSVGSAGVGNAGTNGKGKAMKNKRHNRRAKAATPTTPISQQMQVRFNRGHDAEAAIILLSYSINVVFRTIYSNRRPNCNKCRSLINKLPSRNSLECLPDSRPSLSSNGMAISRLTRRRNNMDTVSSCRLHRWADRATKDRG